MENNINAYCTICSKGYHVCNSCLEQKTFRPWRTVTDTIEHYKIYLALHGYTISKNKEQAKSELEQCDLSGLKSFNPEVRSVIYKIMEQDKKNRPVQKVCFRKQEKPADVPEDKEPDSTSKDNMDDKGA